MLILNALISIIIMNQVIKQLNSPMPVHNHLESPPNPPNHTGQVKWSFKWSVEVHKYMHIWKHSEFSWPQVSIIIV